MLNIFRKKTSREAHQETEYWEKINRKEYAKELMYNWNRWDNVKKLNPYALKILAIATASHPTTRLFQHEGLGKLDIEMHLKRTAYALITYQPQTHRKTIIPKYGKLITFWRCIQILLFFIITFELCPDPESEAHINGLLVAWLFIAFTAISAYCRFSNTRDYEIARDRATLNAIVNEDYLAAYLRTPECADFMRNEYRKPGTPHQNAIRTYLTWYEHHGKHECEKYKSHARSGSPL